MTIGERITKLLKEQGKMAKDLAIYLGISASSVTGWARGSYPSSQYIIKISEFLNVSAEFLLTGKENELFPANEIKGIGDDALEVATLWNQLDKPGKTIILGEIYRRREALTAPKEVRIRYVVPAFQFSPEPPLEPVRYKTSRNAQPMSAGTGIEAGDDGPEDFMLVKQPPRGTSYVAPVSGDSMEPTFHDGDELFVHACSDINPGQIGVFLMDGKQWVKELGDGVLVSHNSEYDPIPITEDVRCQGLVLGVCDASYLDLRQTQ